MINATTPTTNQPLRFDNEPIPPRNTRVDETVARRQRAVRVSGVTLLDMRRAGISLSLTLLALGSIAAADDDPPAAPPATADAAAAAAEAPLPPRKEVGVKGEVRDFGVSWSGEVLVVQARYVGSLPKSKKAWIEGYRVSDGKQLWKAALDAYFWDIFVLRTRVAVLLKGKVKLLDVETGRPKAFENTSKTVAVIDIDKDGRFVWAATEKGRLIPLR